MNPRELLQAMNPLGVYDDWSNEDVLSQLLWQLRQAIGRRYLLPQTWRN